MKSILKPIEEYLFSHITGCGSIRGLLLWTFYFFMCWLVGSIIEDHISLDWNVNDFIASKSVNNVPFSGSIQSSSITKDEPRDLNSDKISSDNFPLINLFTTMMNKDSSEKQAIQNNTVHMYHWLKPWVEGVVFSEFPSIQKSVHELGIEARVPKINKYKVPFLRDMFHQLESRPGYFYGYHNGDILFNFQMIDTLRAIKAFIEAGILHKKVSIVGRRSNYNFKTFTDRLEDIAEFSKGDLSDANVEKHFNLFNNKVQEMKRGGVLFQTNAEDFFIYSKGWIDWPNMPDYVIGRPGYDNAIVRWANINSDISSISVTDSMGAIHQTGTDGVYAGHHHSENKDDHEWNYRAADFKFDLGLTTDCRWRTRRSPSGKIELLHDRKRRAVYDPDTDRVIDSRRFLSWIFLDYFEEIP